MTTVQRMAAMLVAGWLASLPVCAAEIAGVKLDDTIRIDGSDLVLNGAGLRTKMFFKVYVGALYLPRKNTSATAIIESKDSKRVVMQMLRDLDADSLLNATLDGLKKNHDEAAMNALKADIDQFSGIMRTIGQARKADVILIDISTTGVAVTFNGQARGTIAGEAFGKALLRVWLGDKPADDDLKRAMLGI